MAPKYINSADDLVTSHEETVKGFLEQAIQKMEIMAPMLMEAQKLKDILRIAKNVNDIYRLTKDAEILEAISTAAGFSEKSKQYMSEEEQRTAIKRILLKVGQSKENHIDAIIFRFLLIRGDSLGGSMRNLIGSKATKKMASRITSKLEREKSAYSVATSAANVEKITRISWGGRAIFFDTKPPFFDKNIDIIMVNTELEGIKGILDKPEAYRALGELKGGIDPAGADEHWKTARSALERIREAFAEMKIPCPPLFFVGAAIENAMATEIYNDLLSGKLSHAANLTNENQLSDLVEWLLNL